MVAEVALHVPHDAATMIAAGYLNAEALIEVGVEGFVSGRGLEDEDKLRPALAAGLVVPEVDKGEYLELGIASRATIIV